MTTRANGIGDEPRPLIGISPRCEPFVPNEYVHDQLSANQVATTGFVDALIEAGGLPVMLPLTSDAKLIARYVALCDAFALPGGQDVSPRMWGDERPYEHPEMLCEERDVFEIELVRQVVRTGKPIFTICRGTQVLNVALGGTLCMDVGSFPLREGATLWRHRGVLSDPAHPVEIRPNSLLARCVGQELVQANSSHHCCVDRLGEGLVLSAEATDGIPEAVELEGYPFCLGVQWHPEHTWQQIPTDFALWRAFVDAARRSQAGEGVWHVSEAS